MSGRPIAESLVRAWVRLYTLGLSADDRFSRRAEIESDLWEHRNQAEVDGEQSTVTSLSIAGRWAAGIPADLSWRTSQSRRRGPSTKETLMTNALSRYWKALAGVTAVATGYQGIDQFRSDEISVVITAGKAIALLLFVGLGVLVLSGLVIHRTNPRRGALLVVLGVLPAAAVGGFGIGLVFGVIASLAGGLGWWWLPVAIASLVATAAGVGAFGSWWHASPNVAGANLRTMTLPIALVLVGLFSAGAGVSFGWSTGTLVGLGAAAAVAGVAVWTQRLRTVS